MSRLALESIDGPPQRVVFPYEQVIQQYILQEGKFQTMPLAEITIKSVVLEGLEVDIDTVFDTIAE